MGPHQGHLLPLHSLPDRSQQSLFQQPHQWGAPACQGQLSLLIRKVFLSLSCLTCWSWPYPLKLYRTKQIHFSLLPPVPCITQDRPIIALTFWGPLSQDMTLSLPRLTHWTCQPWPPWSHFLCFTWLEPVSVACGQSHPHVYFISLFRKCNKICNLSTTKFSAFQLRE